MLPAGKSATRPEPQLQCAEEHVPDVASVEKLGARPCRTHLSPLVCSCAKKTPHRSGADWLSPGQVDPVIERDNPGVIVSRYPLEGRRPGSVFDGAHGYAAPWGSVPKNNAPLEPKAAGRPLLDGPLLRERSSHVE